MHPCNELSDWVFSEILSPNQIVSKPLQSTLRKKPKKNPKKNQKKNPKKTQIFGSSEKTPKKTQMSNALFRKNPKKNPGSFWRIWLFGDPDREW